MRRRGCSSACSVRAPVVAVPNTFVWDDAVERAWAGSGVRCIVTRGVASRGVNGRGH